MIYRRAAVRVAGFSPVALARKVFVLQGPQVAPIPGAIPSTDNPLERDDPTRNRILRFGCSFRIPAG